MSAVSGFDIPIDVWTSEVEEVAQRASDITEALDGSVHQLHIEQTQIAFFTSGQTTMGGTWRPLSPKYLQRKRGGGTLRLTHDLMNSYTDPTHGDHVYEFTVGTEQVFLEAGSRHELAAIHEFGATLWHGGRIWPRSLEKSDEDAQAIDDEVWGYIIEGGR